MSASRSAVVAGHICLDVIPDMTDLPEVGIPRLFRPGRLLEVGGVTFSTGGAVSNTGLSLYRLGVPVRLMGKIGDDLFGQAVRQIVSGYDPQLAEGMVVDPSVNTSYTIIISPPAVDRVFLHCPDANDVFGVDDILYDIVEKSDLFHFGYPPLMRLMYTDDGRQLVDIYRRVKDLGVTTSLDMALPDPASQSGRADWLGILEDVLP
ncbi:MAG: carbohydrate kinase family protein, partial [Anaerolineae bacterium]|nr:carbohydrate kinase family protein [Anaerolineae bacterium]